MTNSEILARIESNKLKKEQLEKEIVALDGENGRLWRMAYGIEPSPEQQDYFRQVEQADRDRWAAIYERRDPFSLSQQAAREEAQAMREAEAAARENAGEPRLHGTKATRQMLDEIAQLRG